MKAVLRFVIATITCAMLVASNARGSSAESHPESVAWNGARVVPTQTSATIMRNGKPFFIWGAAFFYERIPRARWAATLASYHKYGITTIDLYIPWNWHESADGVYDFDGTTNPRRDLRGLLAMIEAEHFAIVVRPGPVIRNEWRNGGYPAWLLEQPAYDMPMHDILEGRYPATATLQNAHSDDAAAEWMRNATHMQYAERWLHRVAAELRPFRNDIVAWQLDDDQAAYIDNQTWPAPHLQAYLETLAAIVRSDVGPSLPLFINTYEMKVPASSPVLAFGNWYQSEAYAFGEHDRTELEFATALLQTQPHAPIVASEFQAGWLQGPGDAFPRNVDPNNTLLALHTLLQLGAHGAIDFPLQDTLAPAGWEAPFANGFYAWDAALRYDGSENARALPTQFFGDIVTRYGRALARAHRVTDAAIVWPISAYDETKITNDDVFSAVARTKETLRFCRDASLTCDLVDLRYADDARLRAYPIVFVPQRGARQSMRPRERNVLSGLARHAVIETDDIAYPTTLAAARARADALLDRAKTARAIDGVKDAVLLETDANPPERFLDVVNLTDIVVPLAPAVRRTTGRGTARLVPRDPRDMYAYVAPQRAFLDAVRDRPQDYDASHHGNDRVAVASTPTPDGIAMRDDPIASLPSPSTDEPRAYRADAFDDGAPLAILENRVLRVAMSPDAGARIVALVDRRDGFNRVTSVGGLRDDVSVQLPISPRDYIGKYTHDYPAGFFNRAYAANVSQAIGASCDEAGHRARVRTTATIADVVDGPLAIEKDITLGNDATASVTMRGTFAATVTQQRLTSLTSLAGGPLATRAMWTLAMPETRTIAPGTRIDIAGGGFAFFGADGRATRFSWSASERITARVVGRADDIDVLLAFPTTPATFAITTGIAVTPEQRLAFTAPIARTRACREDHTRS